MRQFSLFILVVCLLGLGLTWWATTKTEAPPSVELHPEAVLAEKSEPSILVGAGPKEAAGPRTAAPHQGLRKRSAVQEDALRVQVVDPEGNPSPGSWRVFMKPMRGSQALGGKMGVVTPVDADTGFARFTGLARGHVRIGAVHEHGFKTSEKTLMLRPGGGQLVQLRFVGDRLDKQISVRVINESMQFNNRSRHTSLPSDMPVPGTMWLEREGRRVKNLRRLSSAQGNIYLAKGLEIGDYSIVLQDPNFEAQRMKGVRTGDSPDLHIQASGSLDLRVLNEQGEETSQYGIEIQWPDMNTEGAKKTLREMGDELPADGIIRGLGPGRRMVMVVDGGAAGIARMDLAKFTPGEHREVLVRLTSNRLRVRVLQGVMGVPLPSARVAFFDDVRVSGTYLTQSRSTLGWAARVKAMTGVIGAGLTDQAGEIDFPDPQKAGTWLHVNDSMHAEQVLDVSGEVTVRLPGIGSISARVLGIPPEGLPKGCGLILVSQEVENSPSLDEKLLSPRRSRFRLKIKDGRVVQPLTAGSYSLQWRMSRSSEHPMESGFGFTKNLADVVVTEGQTTHVICDIREFLPGTVEVLVLRKSRPVAGQRVALRLAEDADAVRVRLHHGKTNAQGLARIGLVEPGLWSTVIRLGAGQGSMPGAASIRVHRGQVTRTQIDIDLHWGKLFLVDKSSGDLLSRKAVEVRIPNDIWRMKRTDEEGGLRLSLPAGPVEVALHEFRHNQGKSSSAPFGSTEQPRVVRILWGPGGPIPSRVELPPSKPNGRGRR